MRREGERGRGGREGVDGGRGSGRDQIWGADWTAGKHLCDTVAVVESVKSNERAEQREGERISSKVRFCNTKALTTKVPIPTQEITSYGQDDHSKSEEAELDEDAAVLAVRPRVSSNPSRKQVGRVRRT